MSHPLVGNPIYTYAPILKEIVIIKKKKQLCDYPLWFAFQSMCLQIISHNYYHLNNILNVSLSK